MNNIESQIIELIQHNNHLSQDVKQRYILALFLMGSQEQAEYLNLLKAFEYRCNAVERGIFILNDDDKQEVLRSLDDVKKDILKKIHSE